MGLFMGCSILITWVWLIWPLTMDLLHLLTTFPKITFPMLQTSMKDTATEDNLKSWSGTSKDLPKTWTLLFHNRYLRVTFQKTSKNSMKKNIISSWKKSSAFLKIQSLKKSLRVFSKQWTFVRVTLRMCLGSWKNTFLTKILWSSKKRFCKNFLQNLVQHNFTWKTWELFQPW